MWEEEEEGEEKEKAHTLPFLPHLLTAANLSLFPLPTLANMVILVPGGPYNNMSRYVPLCVDGALSKGAEMRLKLGL